jgi:hypothetical protein
MVLHPGYKNSTLCRAQSFKIRTILKLLKITVITGPIENLAQMIYLIPKFLNFFLLMNNLKYKTKSMS